MPQEFDRGRIKGTDPRVRAVTDRIGRGYRPRNPELYDKAQASLREGTSIQDALDALDAERPGRSPRESVAGGGKMKPAAVRGSGQVSLAWDDDPKAYGWHYSPAENAEGIRRGGLDPQFRGRHGDASQGIHFSDSPDTYRPIGDKDWNVYRVRREHIPDPVARSTDDFFTRSRIEPKHIEAYEGPGRFGRVGSRVTGAAGLYNMLAPFLGLPYMQTPSDWIINNNLMESDASPWNPENQMGYVTQA